MWLIIRLTPGDSGSSPVFRQKELTDQLLPKQASLAPDSVSCAYRVSPALRLQAGLLPSVCRLFLSSLDDVPVREGHGQGAGTGSGLKVCM